MRKLQIITFLPIFEIGHCALGSGGAVGAGRELPAHPRVPALTMPILIMNLPQVTIYAHAGINRNDIEIEVDNDAARRVATSSEKRENRF